MADSLQPPVLVKSIPPLVTYETASFGPFDLKNHIKGVPTAGLIRFSATLVNGESLPAGMICTENGLISGIPPVGTTGVYEVRIFAENDFEEPLMSEVDLTIRPKLSPESPDYLNNLKSQVWQALGSNAPIPDLANFWDRAISPAEIQYLLERFGVLTVWDVFNLDSPVQGKLLSLQGASEHYNVYDRGSCLVAAPKDLFSHARTLEDALQTSRAVVREVYQRGWTVEFAGLGKMMRAAWVEAQQLEVKHGKKLSILHYTESVDDRRILQAQASAPNVPSSP